MAELDGSGAVVARIVYWAKLNIPEYMVKGGVNGSLGLTVLPGAR